VRKEVVHGTSRPQQCSRVKPNSNPMTQPTSTASTRRGTRQRWDRYALGGTIAHFPYYVRDHVMMTSRITSAVTLAVVYHTKFAHLFIVIQYHFARATVFACRHPEREDLALAMCESDRCDTRMSFGVAHFALSSIRTTATMHRVAKRVLRTRVLRTNAAEQPRGH
jgi:hypothetical protein